MASDNRHVVCRALDVAEGQRIIVQVGHRSMGIYNIRGRFLAIRNVCPHAGAPICEGTLSGAIVSDGLYDRHLDFDGCILKCPWHAWEFKLPEGSTITEPKRRLHMYPVQVEDGNVVVELRTPSRGSPAGVAGETA